MVRAAVENFVRSIAVHYPPRHPDEASEDEWLRSIYDDLRHYSDDVLAEAATHLRRHHRGGNSFPKPRDYLAACEEAARRQRLLSAPLLVAPETDRPQSGGFTRLADELIHSPLGRRAADEGWILSLHDFIRNHGRLPTERSEINRCIEGAKSFDEAYAACARGDGGWANASLLALGDSMLARRRKLAERVAGGHS